ncbi:YxeA family protein [Enterococcus hirae]
MTSSVYFFFLPTSECNNKTEDNKEKDIAFDSFKDKPLKENAYLVLHVNKSKGVVGWEEVNTKDIPSSVLNKLDSN